MSSGLSTAWFFNCKIELSFAAMETDQPPAAVAAASAAPAASTAPIVPATPAPALPPQELLATKTQGRPDPPTSVERTFLGTSSFVDKFSDGNIYVTTDSRKELITEPLYQILLKNNSTKRLASSTFTGAISAKGDDEPIEWGDMDPSFRQFLESTPAVLEAYKTLKNPKKMAKLGVPTRIFQATTHVEVPAPSSTVTIPDTVKSDDIKAVIQHYHDTSVQPSTELLSKHIREEVTRRLGRNTLQQYLGQQTLTSLEAEQQRRSVSIYNVPPFTTMATISPNMKYLLGQAGRQDCDVQSVSNHLQTSSTAFLKVIFVNETSSKAFLQSFRSKKRYWHSNNQDDVLLKIERDIPMQGKA